MFSSWMTLTIPDYDYLGPSLKKQMAANFTLGFFNYIPIPFMFVGLAATSYVFNHNPLYFLILKGEEDHEAHEDAVHVIS